MLWQADVCPTGISGPHQPMGRLVPRAPWAPGPLVPPGFIAQTIFTFFKLLKMRPKEMIMIIPEGARRSPREPRGVKRSQQESSGARRSKEDH